MHAYSLFTFELSAKSVQIGLRNTYGPKNAQAIISKSLRQMST